MNKNTLDKPYVQKNIELLELYSTEEKDTLNKIFDKYYNCLDYYKTSNTSTLNRKISTLQENVSRVSSNREECRRILNKAISVYDETAQDFVSSAGTMGGNIGV